VSYRLVVVAILNLGVPGFTGYCDCVVDDGADGAAGAHETMTENNRSRIIDRNANLDNSFTRPSFP